jgi:hypothetical protein
MRRPLLQVRSLLIERQDSNNHPMNAREAASVGGLVFFHVLLEHIAELP